MFERLLAFLKQLPGAGADRDTEPDANDPRVAAAALMFHVMDADGVRHDVERKRLEAALTRTYGISGGDLTAVVKAAEEAAHEAVDLYAFTSVLKRNLEMDARIEFIGIMWEIVFADGEMSELEDNIVWRVAELIGVDRRDRIAMRQRAEAASGPETAADPGD
jgi:uncharacterized tellurite resistance protein B-like protein